MTLFTRLLGSHCEYQNALRGELTESGAVRQRHAEQG